MRPPIESITIEDLLKLARLLASGTNKVWYRERCDTYEEWYIDRQPSTYVYHRDEIVQELVRRLDIVWKTRNDIMHSSLPGMIVEIAGRNFWLRGMIHETLKSVDAVCKGFEP